MCHHYEHEQLTERELLAERLEDEESDELEDDDVMAEEEPAAPPADD